jgi:hypothetical protein
MSDDSINQNPLPTFWLIMSFVASVIGTIYLALMYLAAGSECTGTGSACVRTIACTVGVNTICVLGIANLIFMPFFFTLVYGFGLKQRYWIVMLVIYTLLIIVLGLAGDMTNPAYAGKPCIP